jgi:hypothetical protein
VLVYRPRSDELLRKPVAGIASCALAAISQRPLRRRAGVMNIPPQLLALADEVIE